MTTHHAPRACPVCGDRLLVTRLSCDACETELSGQFEPCEFCALAPEDRELLRVFLASRGNLKDLQRHLDVSYPTARARFARLLSTLGIETGAEPDERLDVLEALARGEIDVDDAMDRIER